MKGEAPAPVPCPFPIRGAFAARAETPFAPGDRVFVLELSLRILYLLG